MYDRQPHGLVGKGYVPSKGQVSRFFAIAGVIALFIIGSIFLDVIGVFVIAAPFWIIAIIGFALAVAFAGFVALLTRVRGGES